MIPRLASFVLSATLSSLLFPNTVAFNLLHGDSLETPVHQIPFLQPTAELPYILRVSPAQWESLNSSVFGRLHRSAPFARECFKTFNGKDDDDIDEFKCSIVQHGYRNETLRTSHPAAQINPQWETCQAHAQGCLLDYKDTSNKEATKRTCEIGSLSTHYIEVHDAEDVKAAFAFSRSSLVPLVVKNTGHDYKGRSTAPHSLELWTHKLQDMEYHEKFTPSCPATRTSTPVKFIPAVTLGAGVQWYQAYAFAEQNNITLVGGADRTVGAVGGWLQGGGHGALSNTMGLGVDRVLEFKVVTPDGELRIANNCQNKDLFFALRGGGGGTFGVVISATIIASPPVRIQATLIQFPMGLSSSTEYVRKGSLTHGDTVLTENIIDAEGVGLAVTRSLWSVLLDNSLRWAQEGWGGYVTGNSALYINPVLDDKEAVRSMKPLVEWATQLRESAPAQMQKNVSIVQGDFGTWGHFFTLFADGNSADLGEPLAIASRLVPTSSVSSPEERDALLQALLSAERIAPGVRFLITTPFSYTAADTIEEQDQFMSPSVHPAWRDSIFHITTVATWNWNATQSEIANKYKTVSEAISGLAKLSNAAYHNEADVYESNWQDTFWGENYATLLSIKHKYDPDHLLDCWHCVGWNSDSSRFSCYL